ncbi:MAG: 7-carboxy-7-deazaguanine synthase QueE [Syntrophomonadaceae bacterium]
MMPAVKSGPASPIKADLREIMESVQGEGLLMGCLQVFVRLTGCNLSCSYCDTPESREPSASCRVYPQAGRRFNVQDVANPVSPSRLSEIIQKYFTSRWVSFTGGEPLLHADYIKDSAALLKPLGYRLFLETNGTLPGALAECLECIDYISMDWKLPSAVGATYSLAHERFLSLAMQKPCYVKMVIAQDSEESEIRDAFKRIANINPITPVILQIATPGPSCQSPDMDKMLAWQELGLQYLEEVRILPQMHRLLGLT